MEVVTTVTNATLAAHSDAPGLVTHALITLVYLLGVLGNFAALGFLYGSDNAPRNPIHCLLLRCLAFNDLTAVLGMWIQMNLKSHFPSIGTTHAFCVFRVLWRSLGLGSGCIVCVMAIDRWIALTRPFFYQKYVTISLVRKAIVIFWLVDLLLVCLPFLGFGIYYENGRCIRYKQAVKPMDRAYAYLYLTFGTLLCVCLILCNTAVIRALTAPKRQKKVLVRRISRNRDLTSSAATKEETAFAKLMATLCCMFFVAWLPQLLTVPLAQVYPDSLLVKKYMLIADLILALHFFIDPYFYILQRWAWFKKICKKKPSSRGNSVKTTELCSL